MLGGPAAGAGDGLAAIPSAVIPERTQDLNGLSEQVTMSSPHTQGGRFQGQRVDCNWLSYVHPPKTYLPGISDGELICNKGLCKCN